MIGFSHPWALLLALPAAWLLWRSRRRSVETFTVANLFLWQDSAHPERVPVRERRAHPPWLVWLQAAVLIAVSVAIAAPSRIKTSPDAVLIVDVSASMGARTPAGSRLELARAVAQTWLAARPSRTVRLIAAGTAPRDAAFGRADAAELSTAIGALEVLNEPGDLARAIDSAKSQTGGEISVITDLGEPPNAGALGVSWQQVGSPTGNVAITGLTGTDDGGALLEVTNFSDVGARVLVDVTGGATRIHEPLTIPADEARTLMVPSGPDRTIAATLSMNGTADNALTSDDRMAATVGPRNAVDIALAGGEPMIAAALRSLPDATVRVIADSAGAQPPSILVCAIDCDAAPTLPALVFRSGGTIPLIRRTESNGIRRISVDVDFKSSPWPLTAAFPLFVADAIDWLTFRSSAPLSAARLAVIAESDTRSNSPPQLNGDPIAPVPPPKRTLIIALSFVALIGLAVELSLRRRAPALRIAAAALTGAAIAGLPLPIGGTARSAIAVVDASLSVAGSQRAAGERVRQETAFAGPNDRLDVLKFGGAATDIASGIRAGVSRLAVSGDRRLLLISDGQQTDGDAVEAARRAAAAGVAIDVAPVDSRKPAYIERVDAPATVHAGATVPIQVAIKGSAREVLTVSVSRNGASLDQRRVVLDDAGEARVVMSDAPKDAGLASYHVILDDDRLGIRLSEGGAAVNVGGRGRVLVISNRRVFASTIAAAPFDVVETAPASAPDTPGILGAFAAIVLDDVPLHTLTTRQLDAIATAVLVNGTGLLVLGSADSLDASEFSPSAFVDALPLVFTALPHPPSATSSLALLVDISGSMASSSDGVTKISAARAAIGRALAVVPQQDAVQVIGFAERPVVLVGPADPRDAASISAKLASLSPSGSTALAPAVSDAVAWLSSTSNQRKRLVLVTDGKTSTSDAEATRAAVRGHSIEVSVITIGSDAEREWLSELAASTGGRAFFPNRLTELAREVAREAARSETGRVVDEQFTVRNGAHPLAPGDPAPALGGYIAARLRNGATAAWKSHTDDAVLAAWPRGLGRVAAYTADLGGPWSVPLRSWPAHQGFWVRALQWIARGDDPSNIDAEFTSGIDGQRLVVEIPGDAAQRAGELPAVRAIIAGPGGQTASVQLHASTPTRFQGSVRLGDAGDYRATIVVSDPSSARESRTLRGWYWTGDVESQSRGMNAPLLADIAHTSGGRVLPGLGEAATAENSLFGGARTRSLAESAPWLLAVALALLSLDYIRRAVEV